MSKSELGFITFAVRGSFVVVSRKRDDEYCTRIRRTRVKPRAFNYRKSTLTWPEVKKGLCT